MSHVYSYTQPVLYFLVAIHYLISSLSIIIRVDVLVLFISIIRKYLQQCLSAIAKEEIF